MLVATAVVALAVWLCTANRVLPLLGFAGVVGMLLCWLGGHCFKMPIRRRYIDFIANELVGAFLLAAGLFLTAVSIFTALISQR
jgi:hypothetical protein